MVAALRRLPPSTTGSSCPTTEPRRINERFKEATEKLAARNKQARQDLQARQSLAPWQRGYRSF